MSHEILLRQLQLGAEDRPFVLVGVVRTEGPTAIKAGNKAIILGDGAIEGWVGGHCTEAEIVSSALECLKSGSSKVLNLSTCQGGRMDVYLEPYLPKRKMILIGHVPIVKALASFAKSLNFSVYLVDKTATKEKYPEADEILPSLDWFRASATKMSQTYVVIATMGARDLEYAEEVSKWDIPYIGVVAGKKRASELFAFLRAKETPEEQLSRIRAPAGIYIRAVTAEEIALSIMSEIIELARTKASAIQEDDNLLRGSSMVSSGQTQQSKVFVDPVCGMTVESSSQQFSKPVGDLVFYFCSKTCMLAFDSNPEKYLLQTQKL